MVLVVIVVIIRWQGKYTGRYIAQFKIWYTFRVVMVVVVVVVVVVVSIIR